MADGGKALGAKGDAANSAYIYHTNSLAKCQSIFTNTIIEQILPGGKMT
jgi:hypothetical protein